MRNYDAGLKKADLIDRAYYRGICRHATEARWDGVRQRFYHWRTKLGSTFVEEIAHNEDEKNFEVFNAIEQIERPQRPIPLPPRKATHVRYKGREYEIEECLGAVVRLKGEPQYLFGIGDLEYLDE
jgi:hypothetical protein